MTSDGGEDDECAIRGCNRDATKKEMCTVCNEAYQQGLTVGEKQSEVGVRGREEIQEEIKRLKNGIGSVSHVQSVVRSAKVMALEWVLGEVDDL